jgi:hypothetical protein
MLSLSMVVIASMIAVGGLGLMVLRGIGRLDMGLAAVGGLGIVILAIVLDRITQTMGQPRRDQRQRWTGRGPIGEFIVRFQVPSSAMCVLFLPGISARSIAHPNAIRNCRRTPGAIPPLRRNHRTFTGDARWPRESRRAAQYPRSVRQRRIQPVCCASWVLGIAASLNRDGSRM